MKVDLESFASWDDVLKHASTGKRLFYQAPLDPTLRLILVKRVYKNGKIRIWTGSVASPSLRQPRTRASPRTLHWAGA